MDFYVGQIILASFSGRTPQGLFPCNGALVQITQYPALYSLLGTQYGGNGQTTFALPNLPAPTASNQQATTNQLTYYICWNGIYPNFG